MPAPLPADIRSEIEAALPPAQFPVPYQQWFDEFLDKLSEGFSTGWDSWQSGITGGENVVTGAGLGTWVGIGLDGVLVEGTPLDFTIDVTNKPPRFTEFETELVLALKNEFNSWATSFVFTSVPYSGTSLATPDDPGDFNAVGALPPAPIGTLGTGTNPQAIRPIVVSALDALGFDSSNPEFRLNYLLDAIDTALASIFTTWLGSTNFSGDSVSGTAAPGSGAGSATSDGNGVLT